MEQGGQSTSCNTWFIVGDLASTTTPWTTITPFAMCLNCIQQKSLRHAILPYVKCSFVIFQSQSQDSFMMSESILQSIVSKAIHLGTTNFTSVPPLHTVFGSNFPPVPHPRTLKDKDLFIYFQCLDDIA